MSAPFTGGAHAGADRFYVDGDLTVPSPISAPIIYNAFKGDSGVSLRDIILLNSSNAYQRIPLGSGANIQPFKANQTAIILEQEFVVAQQFFFPLALNTPYNGAWSVGWGNDYVNLATCFLVEEGQLEPIGGGLSRFVRKYANLPPNRNEYESFTYTFPGVDYGGGIVRQWKPWTVDSRVQHDYYLMDQLNLQTGIPLFPSGHRLNAATGMQPPGLILPEMRYFAPDANAVVNNIMLSPPGALAADTTPTNADYSLWAFNTNDSLRAELVVESTKFNRFLGNIFERVTRFAVAQ